MTIRVVNGNLAAALRDELGPLELRRRRYFASKRERLHWRRRRRQTEARRLIAR